MSGGNDTVTLETGTKIINGDIDGDLGTDTLNLYGSGAVTWNIYSFEKLTKDWSGRWTLETDLDLLGSGATQILFST